jgi:hypothetical protein
MVRLHEGVADPDGDPFTIAATAIGQTSPLTPCVRTAFV